MFRQGALRLACWTCNSSHCITSSASSLRNTISRTSRSISHTPRLREETADDRHHDASTAVEPGAAGQHKGSASRTDNQISFEYPDEQEVARSKVVQGRGRFHMKRTLPSFLAGRKVAVVTGGAQEEGEHQAKELVANFQKENPNSEQYGRANFPLGKKDGVFRTPKVTAHYCDVASPDCVHTILGEIIAKHGKIDHLVTSAGFTENFDAISYPYEWMKKLWRVHVDGACLFATGVAKYLMERRTPGSMVMIGSISGVIVNVLQPQAPYNAAKVAIRHLVASLAVEWAHANIGVNCISPGYMLNRTRKLLDNDPDLNPKWTLLIPVGKMGRPEDLMGAVTFLLSDAKRIRHWRRSEG